MKGFVLFIGLFVVEVVFFSFVLYFGEETKSIQAEVNGVEKNHELYRGIMFAVEKVRKDMRIQVDEKKEENQKITEKKNEFTVPPQQPHAQEQINLQEQARIDNLQKFWHRNVPDLRPAACKDEEKARDVNGKWPTFSVVMTFINETDEILGRSVVSILSRTPLHLLKEIILVDDFNPIKPHKSILSLDKVVMVSNTKREGLIRSRISGADRATGEVLIFLDSHIEVTEGWVFPLLERIQINRKTIVTPIIETITDDGKFDFVGVSIHHKGAFSQDMVFNWIEVKRDASIPHHTPFDAPAMAGGLFAIHKGWWEEVGKYDSQMEIWGIENIEMSLRVWQCGGKIEQVPCSHIGHIFKVKTSFNYDFPGGSGHVVNRNKLRTISVWMDEFAPFFYRKIIGVNSEAEAKKALNFGDVSERRNLRKNLQCKSMRWYFENVYPELYKTIIEQNPDLTPAPANVQPKPTTPPAALVTATLSPQEVEEKLQKFWVREVPDYRPAECKPIDEQNRALLAASGNQGGWPTFSVIITFINESDYILGRTVRSILNRSPDILLKEIILVDDFNPIKPHPLIFKMSPKVKMVSNAQREGLIRSRLNGAKEATGDVLIFFDSHIEPTTGWLFPLLERIKIDRRNVPVPIIDVISDENYEWSGVSMDYKGSFNEDLNFNWIEVKRAAGTPYYHPFHAPAMPGGLFAIEKKFFYEMGTYDDQMEIWGSENIEMSLRLWQCGGFVEMVPCSHVGHIFKVKKAHFYDYPKGVGFTLNKNKVRMISVWMDEFKNFFYKRTMGLSDEETVKKTLDFGSVEDRKKFRSDMKCKSMRWYFENIFPELYATVLKLDPSLNSTLTPSQPN